MKKIHQYWIS